MGIRKAYTNKLVKRRVRRLAVIDALGSKCSSCGANDHRVLEIDHVEGGGSKMSSSDTHKMMRELEGGTYAGPPVQLLCANCHRIKTFWPSIGGMK